MEHRKGYWVELRATKRVWRILGQRKCYGNERAREIETDVRNKTAFNYIQTGQLKTERERESACERQSYR